MYGFNLGPYGNATSSGWTTPTELRRAEQAKQDAEQRTKQKEKNDEEATQRH